MWVNGLILAALTGCGLILGWYLPRVTGDEVEKHRSVLLAIRESAFLITVIVALDYYSFALPLTCIAAYGVLWYFAPKWRCIPTAMLALQPTLATGVFVSLVAFGSLEKWSVYEVLIGWILFVIVGVVTGLII